jgi:hypothetical protein
MKAILSILTLICISQTLLWSNNSGIDSLLVVLDNTISNSDEYQENKEKHLAYLKESLKQDNISLQRIYKINFQLMQEYKSYQTDSAIAYVTKNLKQGIRYNNSEQIIESKIHYASILSTMGIYLKAHEILASINRSKIPAYMLQEYYNSMKVLYGGFHEYTSGLGFSENYAELTRAYTDSSYALLGKDSEIYKIVYAGTLLTNNKPKEALEILLPFYQSLSQENHLSAIVCFQISSAYEKQNNSTLQKKYLILSAISDIKGAVKENVSMRDLALLLYNEGDINRASRYIKVALDDATFCNAKLRAISISQALPIIDDAFNRQNEQQKKQLIRYFIFISVLSLFLFASLLILYLQKRNISKARRELSVLNANLKKINENLRESNDKHAILNYKLNESNKIKEEYIGQFLKLCSVYIDKISNQRKLVIRRISTNSINDLLNETKLNEAQDSELKEFYANFDSTFLNLFPSFVKEFNKLLRDDEQEDIKPNGPLNTELRIYALIRLGITDSSEIAKFLRYSYQTIYNYRSRIRNKAKGSRDDFDKIVMEIGTLNT